MSQRLLSWGGQPLPVVLQAESSECGLACLVMVLHHHGLLTDLGTLRRRRGSASRGLNLKGLMQLAEREQLACRPLRVELEELQQLRLPAILHWDMDHFVVLQSVRGRQLCILDPALGERHLTLAEVGKHFTGVALELVPTAGFVPRNEARRLRLQDLWSRARGLWGSLGSLFLLSALIQLFALALPFYTQLFIDDVLVSRDVGLLQILAVGFFMVALVRSGTEWLRSRLVLHLGNSIGFQFAVNVCRHLLRLPLAWYQSRHLGDILSRFGSLNNIRDFISSGVVEVCIDALMVSATLLLMFVYSSMLTWVALLAVLLYLLLRIAVHPLLRARNEEAIHAAAIENSNFMENVRAIQGIRLFGREADRLALWQNLLAGRLNAAVRAQQLGINLRLVHGLLVGTENIVLMLLGGLAVLRNDISIGMIMAYISFKDQFYGRVFALVDKLFEFRLLDLHLARLADIALADAEQHLEGIGAPPPEVCLQGGLVLENLGFRYHPDAPWLFRGLQLEVGNEEVVAIVGPTGCGKSTLLKLVLSLLQAEEGRVLLHGVPVQMMGLRSYRERVAAVLQDDTLLSGSIADNIACFDPLPDQERIEYAASLAALAQEVRLLPMQYNTLVGSQGAALSGGQVQRILLARALYRCPRLLVLDEATSHLDLATERAVNQAIRQLKIARLIVAHRPDTILLADRILELGPAGLRPVSHAEIRARSEQRAAAARLLSL
jgi:ATP-binding cassette subfamily B protein RaxB